MIGTGIIFFTVIVECFRHFFLGRTKILFKNFFIFSFFFLTHFSPLYITIGPVLELLLTRMSFHSFLRNRLPQGFRFLLLTLVRILSFFLHIFYFIFGIHIISHLPIPIIFQFCFQIFWFECGNLLVFFFPNSIGSILIFNHVCIFLMFFLSLALSNQFLIDWLNIFSCLLVTFELCGLFWI